VAVAIHCAARPDDQVNDDLRPPLLALRFEERQRGLHFCDPAGRHRDKQMAALSIL
jgi:hypothetical protein